MTSQHSSESNEWYTPPDYAEAVRFVLGRIDLDPFSCEAANRIIKADYYFTQDQDGFSQPWKRGSGRVFLNPPGGSLDEEESDPKIKASNEYVKRRYGSKSRAACAWAMMAENIVYDQIKVAIYFGFSIEQLVFTQSVGRIAIMHVPFCVPSQRVQCVSSNGTLGKAPPHGSVIALACKSTEYNERFYNAFSKFGAVRL